jgi:molybdate transport system substrate-binding protein
LRWRGRSALAGAALGLVVACASADAEEVTVFAAASLTDALREVGAVFEARTGHKVVYNFGASSDLARQIRAGAPVDLFFSADGPQMDALERAGLVKADERVDVLSNALVIVVPASSRRALSSAADLLGCERIALADPQAVPAGVYARTYLESLGLWSRIKDKVVPLLNVRAALAAVESEHADAGVVYRTDAALSSRVRVALEVPSGQGPPIAYPLASIVGSKKAAALELRRFLVSPEALRVYARRGFVVLQP